MEYKLHFIIAVTLKRTLESWLDLEYDKKFVVKTSFTETPELLLHEKSYCVITVEGQKKKHVIPFKAQIFETYGEEFATNEINFVKAEPRKRNKAAT